MKKCYLYKKLLKQEIQCQTCNHFCKINPNKTGICGVRLNKSGKLYALNCGEVIAVGIDPIEKKPLFHFLPGTMTYTIATAGCNFRCSHCQNWGISQITKKQEVRSKKLEDDFPGQKMTPAEIVEEAIKHNCPSISYSYTEPTIFFEYAYDTMKLAHQVGLKNVWVSNGYMSEQTFKKAAPLLDAINVDLKSFSDKFYRENCGARLKPVLDNLEKIYHFQGAATGHLRDGDSSEVGEKTATETPPRWAKHSSEVAEEQHHKIHLEITTLIIPGKNDSEKELTQLSQHLVQRLGPEVPWHLSRFFPAYKMPDIPPTPISTLKKAKQIGKKAGLKHIYLGNI